VRTKNPPPKRECAGGLHLRTARGAAPRQVAPALHRTQLLRAMLESSAAEHAARMTAMESATKNAGDVIEALTAAHEQSAVRRRSPKKLSRLLAALLTALRRKQHGREIRRRGACRTGHRTRHGHSIRGGHLPAIYNAVRITSEGYSIPEPLDVTAEVQQPLAKAASAPSPWSLSRAWCAG